MTTTPRWMQAIAIALIVWGAGMRLFRLDEVPNFNADEGEYALMALSVLEGEWPSNFIAPTGRPLIGPALWVGHLLWAAFTTDAGPGTIFWLRLPNAWLGVLTLWLWWRWRRHFDLSDGPALLGLAVLSTSISEVLGARMAWDPGAYGVLSLCLLRFARSHHTPVLGVMMVLSLCIHPLMACLLPLVIVHRANQEQPLWVRARTVMPWAAAVVVIIAVLRDKAWLTSMPMRLQALPNYWSVVLSGDQQWHEAIQVMHYDPTLSLAVLAVLLISMLAWRRHHAVAMVASWLLLSSAAGLYVLNWRYGSMFVVPTIIELSIVAHVWWHRRRLVVTAMAGLFFVGQTAALLALLISAPQQNTMYADVQRLFAWSPTHVLADDWWAQRPLLLFGRGHPPFSLIRVLPMRPGASPPEYDERTAFVMLASNPNVGYLLEEGRPSFPFMSSGRSYVAIGPVGATP
jgi:hypothetical protein